MCLYEEFGYSENEVASMSRRQVQWRLELAANRMKLRHRASAQSHTDNGPPQLTEKDQKVAQKGVQEALERVRDRIRGKQPSG